jgi:anti-sigma B factor antagonist
VFTVERYGAWEVLRLEGELDLAVGAELQRDVIQLLPAEENRALAIDLTQVTFIDSTVIGILAMAHKRAGRSGGRVALVGVSGRVERVLQLTGMMTVLDVRPSLDDLGPVGGSVPDVDSQLSP